MDNIKPVGGEYIEEVKDEEGKILSFNCKLCDCKFNDPNAKEMHTKGRRHRLQYKRKVQPDLVVDFKPTPRQRRLAEARAQRALMSSHRGQNANFGEKPGYWGDEQRRRAQFDDEYDYNNWLARSFGGMLTRIMSYSSCKMFKLFEKNGQFKGGISNGINCHVNSFVCNI